MPAKKRILVVDDEPQVCDAISMVLTFGGYEVVTAGSGKEALAKFAQEKFDLVTTDYMMPEMNGVELARALKAQAPDQPVIMITAHSDMLESFGKTPPGVNQVVSKPFQLSDLRAAIQQATAG